MTHTHMTSIADIHYWKITSYIFYIFSFCYHAKDLIKIYNMNHSASGILSLSSANPGQLNNTSRNACTASFVSSSSNGNAW